MDREEFKQQLGELQNIIIDGVAYFSAWRVLANLDQDQARGLDRYRGFFLPARNALLWMALMQFAKVFDNDRKTVSFTNLFAAAKVNPKRLMPHATSESLQQIDEKVSANRDLLRRLVNLRNKRIAHHDRIMAGDVSVPYGQMRDLTEDVKSMYNLLSAAHERSMTMFGTVAEDADQHTSEVVRIMRDLRMAASHRRPYVSPLTSDGYGIGLNAIGNGKEAEREMAQAYCVKCKKKVEIQNPKNVALKNKRPAVQGSCPKCGTKVFRIGKA